MITITLNLSLFLKAIQRLLSNPFHVPCALGLRILSLIILQAFLFARFEVQHPPFTWEPTTNKWYPYNNPL
jgi:hypothetical protein